LSERDPSASYSYLRGVCQRMEAITWEEAEATMALYGSLVVCVQKLWDVHAVWDGSGDLLAYPGRSGTALAGPCQCATCGRGGAALGVWVFSDGLSPLPRAHVEPRVSTRHVPAEGHAVLSPSRGCNPRPCSA
jgi:hypothetical protein